MSALELQGLSAVPSQVALIYIQHASTLANDVSHRVAQHPQIRELLAGNSFRLLEVKHHYHARLMAEVWRTGDLSLLTRTLPWSYHAYHSQGVPFEYFPIQAEAWRAAIQAHLPEEAAAALTPIYDWMIAAHADIVTAASRYESERMPVPLELQQCYPRLLEALLSGDHISAIDLCHDLLNRGMTFVDLTQQLFYPAMVDVGIGWEHGKLSVPNEHLATATAYVVLSTLYYEQPPAKLIRGNAIVAAISNELHELGAWILTACLELDGWDVDFLGGDCSQEALMQAVQRRPPDFIALSVTLLCNVDIARETVAAVRAALPSGRDTKILVGGRALLSAPSLVDSIGADLFLTDCESAVSWVRALETTP